MKTAFLFLLIGIIAGVFGWRYYERIQNPTFAQRTGALADRTKHAAAETKEAVADKAGDLKQNAGQIKAELAKTGQAVRKKARAFGEILSDARIIAVIKGKFIMQKGISTFAITVDCSDGVVCLSGSATSPELVQQAVALALQTGGVRDVVSQLEVRD